MTLNNKLLFKTGCLLKRFLQQSPHFLPILFISVGGVLFFLHILLPHYPVLFCPPPAHSPLGFALSVPRPPVERAFHPHGPTPDLLLCGHTRQPISKRYCTSAEREGAEDRRHCERQAGGQRSTRQPTRLRWAWETSCNSTKACRVWAAQRREMRRCWRAAGQNICDIEGKVEHRGGL